MGLCLRTIDRSSEVADRALLLRPATTIDIWLTRRRAAPLVARWLWNMIGRQDTGFSSWPGFVAAHPSANQAMVSRIPRSSYALTYTTFSGESVASPDHRYAVRNPFFATL
jgi:hypothetical protein